MGKMPKPGRGGGGDGRGLQLELGLCAAHSARAYHVHPAGCCAGESGKCARHAPPLSGGNNLPTLSAKTMHPGKVASL